MQTTKCSLSFVDSEINRQIKIFGNFVDPIGLIETCGFILPLQSVMNCVAEHPMFCNINMQNCNNPYFYEKYCYDCIHKAYKPTKMISDFDIIILYRAYTHSNGRVDKYLEQCTLYNNYSEDETNKIKQVCINKYIEDHIHYIKECNCEFNKDKDDRILRREDGTYYIDKSWKDDLTDEYIQHIIDEFNREQAEHRKERNQ